MRLRRAAGGLSLALLALLAGCGSEPRTLESPRIGRAGTEPNAPQQLGFPAFATKNTTRVGGADPIADAAAVARAVFPGGAPGARPRAVVIADQRVWQGGLAAAVLVSAPLRAPLLLSDGGELPGASAEALDALAPTGASELGGAQIVRVGEVAGARRLSLHDDRRRATRARSPPRSTACRPPPSGTPAARSSSPQPTAPRSRCRPPAGRRRPATRCCSCTATRSPARPSPRCRRTAARASTCSGRPSASSAEASSARCGELGPVTRVAAADPVRSAIAFARYADGLFGWGIVDPGHGLVFANAHRTLDAAAAAPLSASGTLRPAAADRATPTRCRCRSAATCSTSSPATRGTRRAASTITAG